MSLPSVVLVIVTCLHLVTAEQSEALTQEDGFAQQMISQQQQASTNQAIHSIPPHLITGAVPGVSPIGIHGPLLAPTTGQQQAVCYMRGLCPHPLSFNTKLGRQLSPCYAPGSPPVAVTSRAFKRDLEENCPHFFNVDGDLLEPTLCCDHRMKDSMRILLTFARTIMRNCPSCEYNAKILFCNLFCSGSQMKYSRPAGTVKAANGRDLSLDKVQYWVDYSFAYKLYESCKDVSFAGVNVVEQSKSTACVYLPL